MKNENVLLQTNLTLNLMKIVSDSEKFMNLINTNTLIDAKLSILTTEFETVQIDVVDFLSELKWTAYCPETGELLEVNPLYRLRGSNKGGDSNDNLQLQRL